MISAGSFLYRLLARKISAYSETLFCPESFRSESKDGTLFLSNAALISEISSMSHSIRSSAPDSCRPSGSLHCSPYP